ncbi:unnamed protein product [Polarella glacialis]|uniref:Uncharacterized protein n=1 Tax=Polarella glacialis TaxID=89957 RepID=A0A813ENL1_POLGL|nr:unnamed protein product [Polarella glacialis]CAE8599978.1 unnamed protein product [Polarella glacialis]
MCPAGFLFVCTEARAAIKKLVKRLVEKLIKNLANTKQDRRHTGIKVTANMLWSRENRGPTSMNILAPLPTADEPSMTTTQEAILLGNVMARHGVADMTTGTVLSIHSAYCCC